MTAPAYRLESVVKRYDGQEVCRVDHLEVPSGSIMVVMGPNGAGKSTLLRMMAFLEPMSEGTMTFRGQECVNGQTPPLELRRRVTMVFQDSAFFSGTAEQNVAYGLRVRGERDGGERVEGALESVDMLHKARARVSTLSAGEAQRVALARAFVIDPDVLLLDEPTSNLDPKNAALVEALIEQAVEMGTTVVLVTQSVFQGRRLAHHAAFMLDGRLIEAGEPQKLFEDATDPRTRAFVRGDMAY